MVVDMQILVAMVAAWQGLCVAVRDLGIVWDPGSAIDLAVLHDDYPAKHFLEVAMASVAVATVAVVVAIGFDVAAIDSAAVGEVAATDAVVDTGHVVVEVSKLEFEDHLPMKFDSLVKKKGN